MTTSSNNTTEKILSNWIPWLSQALTNHITNTTKLNEDQALNTAVELMYTMRLHGKTEEQTKDLAWTTAWATGKKSAYLDIIEQLAPDNELHHELAQNIKCMDGVIDLAMKDLEKVGIPEMDTNND